MLGMLYYYSLAERFEPLPLRFGAECGGGQYCIGINPERFQSEPCVSPPEVSYQDSD